MRSGLVFAALVSLASYGINGYLFAPSGYIDAQQNYYDLMTYCEREGGECIDVDLGGPSPPGPPDSTDPPPTTPPPAPTTVRTPPPPQRTFRTPPPPVKPLYNILPTFNPFVPFIPLNPPTVFVHRTTTRVQAPVWPHVPIQLQPYVPRMAPILMPQAQRPMPPINPRMRFPNGQRMQPSTVAPRFTTSPAAPPMYMRKTSSPVRRHHAPKSNMLYFPRATTHARPPAPNKTQAPQATTKPTKTIRIIEIEKESPETRKRRAVGADPLGYLYGECHGGWEFDIGCGNRGGNVCCYPASARRRRK